jgi:hypothetical protein
VSLLSTATSVAALLALGFQLGALYSTTEYLPSQLVTRQLDSYNPLREVKASHDGRETSSEEDYLRKWKGPTDVPRYKQVFENLLPPESLHQEGGGCRVGNKLYLIGGAFAPLHRINLTENPEFGSQVVTIYDMKDMSSTFGPDFPYRANHIACAEAPDGVTLHLTGGFNQGATNSSEASHAHHYALDTSLENPTWEKKADMPTRRGAHGCAFLADEKMYCVGGADTQWGPFRAHMAIYDPSKDTWGVGPSMPTPRDHIYETVTAIKEGNQLYVAGGRTHIRELPAGISNPTVWSNTAVVEIYDLGTSTWTRMRDLLTIRDAIAIIPYFRNGPDKEPNLLLVGGETFVMFSGQGHTIIEEYDVKNDLYYCLEPLTWPYYGGAMGIHEGKLHVVGGSEWVGFSATRRVQVYDLERAPPPRQCFYQQVPIFDQWERTWNKEKPYPDLGDTSSVLAVTFQSMA